jgi:hypothetical protein
MSEFVITECRQIRLAQISRLREMARKRILKKCKQDIDVDDVLKVLHLMSNNLVKDERYLAEDIFQDMCEIYVKCDGGEFMTNIYNKARCYAINRLRSRTYRYSSSNKSAGRVGVKVLSENALVAQDIGYNGEE